LKWDYFKPAIIKEMDGIRTGRYNVGLKVLKEATKLYNLFIGFHAKHGFMYSFTPLHKKCF